MNNKVLEYMKKTTADAVHCTDASETVLDGIVMTFDTQEAKGNIIIERGTYGAYIWVNEVCLGMIDLFHLSPESPDGYPQLTVYQQGEDDTLLTVQSFPDKTVVEFDRSWNAIDQDHSELTTTYTYNSVQDNKP